MVVIALQNGPQYIGRYLGLYPLGVKPIADNKKCWSYVFSLSLSLYFFFFKSADAVGTISVINYFVFVPKSLFKLTRRWSSAGLNKMF